MSNSAVAALLPVILGLTGLLLLAAARRQVTDTTLVAAWLWAAMAVLGVALVEGLVALTGADARTGWVTHARYLAGTLTACPAIAVLGSKRPQHHAWQWIVASLWIVLILPSGETWLDRPGDPLELHAARRVFLVGLLLVGWANYLGTRRFIPATLVLAAQGCLLAGVLLGDHPGGATESLRARAGMLLGVLALVWSAAADRSRVGAPQALGVWREFRDLFGCLWALRVAARLNALGQQQDWPVAMDWDGWHDHSGHPAPAPELLPDGQAAQAQLQSLLRRFVGPDWVSRRQGSV